MRLRRVITLRRRLKWWAERRWRELARAWWRHLAYARLRRGHCPMCNSDAPVIDRCPVCEGWRPYYSDASHGCTHHGEKFPPPLTRRARWLFRWAAYTEESMAVAYLGKGERAGEGQAVFYLPLPAGSFGDYPECNFGGRFPHLAQCPRLTVMTSVFRPRSVDGPEPLPAPGEEDVDRADLEAALERLEDPDAAAVPHEAVVRESGDG